MLVRQCEVRQRNDVRALSARDDDTLLRAERLCDGQDCAARDEARMNAGPEGMRHGLGLQFGVVGRRSFDPAEPELVSRLSARREAHDAIVTTRYGNLGAVVKRKSYSSLMVSATLNTTWTFGCSSHMSSNVNAVVAIPTMSVPIGVRGHAPLRRMRCAVATATSPISENVTGSEPSGTSGEAAKRTRNELDGRVLLCLERPPLDEIVSPRLIALQVCDVDHNSRAVAHDRSVLVDDERSGDLFRDADRIVGQIEADELLSNAVSRLVTSRCDDVPESRRSTGPSAARALNFATAGASAADAANEATKAAAKVLESMRIVWGAETRHRCQ